MDLSVIIPCYNSGAFLLEALESIDRSSNLSKYNFETIIVNDGSTDPYTCELLNSLSVKCRILAQNNAGPGAARNTGMKASKGKYILFLDSDNRLLPGFIDTCLTTLLNEKADMVYCQPLFFGDTSEYRFKTRKFDLNDILRDNYIDTCSIITRDVWNETGGFDESPIVIGYEDWEFWIRLGATGYKFHFIDRPLYEYRVSKESLISSKNSLSNRQEVLRYLYSKHIDTIISSYDAMVHEKKVFQNDRNKPFRSLVKFLYLKYIKSKTGSSLF